MEKAGEILKQKIERRPMNNEVKHRGQCRGLTQLYIK